MSEAGWIAIITAVCTFLASVGSAAIVSAGNRNKTIDAVKEELQKVRSESQKTDQEMHSDILLVRKDISTLSERVEKHNSVIERVFKLEQGAAVQTEQIKVANHRIDDLERSEK